MLKNFKICEAQTVFEIFVGFVGLHYGHYGLNEWVQSCKLIKSQGSHLWIFDFQLLRFLVSKYCFL